MERDVSAVKNYKIWLAKPGRETGKHRFVHRKIATMYYRIRSL
jgi:hypothetical protein